VATTELKCERHHTPTHLACAQCGRPACPKCLVWTEVGQKCTTCVPQRGGTSANRVQALVVGALVVALVVAVAIATGAFSGDSDSDVPVAGNTGQRQAGIGQPARDGPLTFVVTKFECPGKELSSDGGPSRTALGRFCVLHFQATNSGNRPASLNFVDQVLLDRQKRRFAPDPIATSVVRQSNAQEPLVPTQLLNPGAQVATSIAYDVPEGITPELAELHAGRSLGVTVKLPAVQA
jgi:hypothetical protein